MRRVLAAVFLLAGTAFAAEDTAPKLTIVVEQLGDTTRASSRG
jgi:hypothetical protein